MQSDYKEVFGSIEQYRILAESRIKSSFGTPAGRDMRNWTELAVAE
jgi:hypothetical protein